MLERKDMPDRATVTRNAIELRDVTVTRREHHILTGISMTVPQRTCCAILGPNGSGKSALMAVVGGYLWPSRGTVVVDGNVYGRVSLGDVATFSATGDPLQVLGLSTRRARRR